MPSNDIKLLTEAIINLERKMAKLEYDLTKRIEELEEDKRVHQEGAKKFLKSIRELRHDVTL